MIVTEYTLGDMYSEEIFQTQTVITDRMRINSRNRSSVTRSPQTKSAKPWEHAGWRITAANHSILLDRLG